MLQRALVLVCALVSLQIRKFILFYFFFSFLFFYFLFLFLLFFLEENDRKQTQSLFNFQA